MKLYKPREKRTEARERIVYISGPITGEEQYLEKFADAELYLKDRCLANVINPALVSRSLPDLPWDAYMDMMLPLLKYCDAIYSLKGWESSAGARIEREYAARLGLMLMEEG